MDEDWLTWVDAHARRTGPVENLRVRPWASVWKVPTRDGLAWLKVMAPQTAFEGPLYEVLVRAAPDGVLHPLAADAHRGWLLLPDGGTSLAASLPRAEVLDALAGELRRYGVLQRAVAGHVDALLAAGVPDMRVARLPERLDEACAAIRARTAGADRETVDAVAALAPAVAAWCDELAALPGTATIDHNDLHPHNVLVDARGHRTVYDWGDAAIAHPFASLLVPLEFCAEQLAAPPDALERLRDAYLDAFTDLGTPGELRRAADLACHVGQIARALTWNRLVEGLEMDARFARAPLETLARLQDRSL